MMHMTKEIAGFESFLGKRWKDSFIDENIETLKLHDYIITRPPNLSGYIHINMYVYYDDGFHITAIKGDKCYSSPNSLYNRSSVHEREFSRDDLRYLRKFLKEHVEV